MCLGEDTAAHHWDHSAFQEVVWLGQPARFSISPKNPSRRYRSGDATMCRRIALGAFPLPGAKAKGERG